MKSLFRLLTLLSSIIVFPLTPWASPFINEFHYDNTGGDTGEGIEIAGLAGTDLSNWSVVLYNGNGGAQYGSIALSGTIPNQQNGFGTVSFSRPGIQNGAPDGMALVDSSTVFQFISYEGAFTAVDGPAAGMTSTDIGVSESSSAPVGSSLGLTGGPGATSADFAWTNFSANTFGAINSGQTFVPLPGAVWFLGSGLIGLVGLRKKFKK